LGCDRFYRLGIGDTMMFPTEAERQARLHKRAGCDCAEGEAMLIDLDDNEARELIAEVEYLRARFSASQEEMTELLTEHRKLIEALEAVIECDRTTPWYDLLTERHAALPRQIARKALGRTCP
jgi:hypothetical protein